MRLACVFFSLVVLSVGSQPCDPATDNSCQCADNESCTVTGVTSLPENLPPTVKNLHVTGGSIEYIVEPIGLINVRQLFLQNCQVRFIGDNVFNRMIALTKLVLSDNAISSLSNKTFGGLNALEQLDLSGNSLYEIHADVFSGVNLPNLNFLKLSKSSIYSIDSMAIQGLLDLVTLDVSLNELSHIPSLHACRKLERINASYNTIYDLSGSPLADLSQLKMLDLTHNEINYVPSDLFQGLTSLNELLLSHNSISSLFGTAFVGLTALSSIDLSRNLLTTLPETTLKQPGISEVKLYDNPWNCNCDIAWMRDNSMVQEFNSHEALKCDQPTNAANQSIYTVDSHVFDCPDDRHGPRSHTVALAIGIVVVLISAVIGSILCYKFVTRKRGSRYSGSPSSGSPYSRVLFVGDSGNI